MLKLHYSKSTTLKITVIFQHEKVIDIIIIDLHQKKLLSLLLRIDNTSIIVLFY